MPRDGRVARGRVGAGARVLLARVLGGRAVQAQRVRHGVGRVVRLLTRREPARAHVVGEVGDGRRRGGAELGVPPDELRLDLVLHPEEVVVHEHLAVAMAARTDTDRGDADGVGDQAGHRVGDALEHDRETAGVDERDRVVDDGASRLELLALDPEAAEGVDGLRRQPQVAHDRDLGVEDRPHRVEALASALRASPRPRRHGSNAAALRTVSSSETW